MKCVLFNTRFLLQRNKLASTNTGAAVAGGLVSHGELGKVVADHFSLRSMREETGSIEQHETVTTIAIQNRHEQKKIQRTQQTLISTFTKNWPL